MSEDVIAGTARTLLRSRLNGVLSTLSVEMGGWPFGSLAPYVLDHQGTPHVLISQLAEHTRNLLADPRVSLLARAVSHGGDAQAVGRVTVLARAEPAAVGETFRRRFIRYLPEAQQYLGMGDFSFYRLNVERVRYIGGFGAIHWIGKDAFMLDMDTARLEDAETGAVAHMNADHGEAMRQYCRSMHSLECASPRMLGIDPEGFDLDTEHGRLRFQFPRRVAEPGELRRVLVDMART
ncbi:MAG: hypothetical protein B7Z66_03055 [Chromatiales bacterium 21-64-14]|nr:MAG: hypothetical protein B7Z66_03055 [Chromatiales bacterium 21-64-14]HQU15690.1 DUF2470 domain-containing protein [Gammaproteobacteria bacterium]